MLLLALAACSSAGEGEPTDTDTDAGVTDAGTTIAAGETDAGAASVDAGESPDAGETPDAGGTPDAGTPVVLAVPGPHRASSTSNKTCALLYDGQARCWGNGQAMLTLIAIEQAGPLVELSQTALEGACGLREDGSIVCVGAHFDAATEGVVPVPQGTGFRSISGGFGFACAIATSAKHVHCWGTPMGTVLQVPEFEAHHVAAGNDHACAITTAGEVKCWGSTPVSVLPGGPCEEVGASGGYVCGRTSEGVVRCNGGAPAADK